MRRLLPFFLFPLAALAADAQTAPAPAPLLAGRVESASRITRIAAVDRAWVNVTNLSGVNPKDTFLYEGTVNDKGEFQIPQVLAGRSYDLLVWTAGNDGTVVRWEGVNMDYHRAITPSTPATAEDRKAIEALITDPPQFFDRVRPLKIAADHQHATVLVEMVRTKDFHGDAGGEMIYRVELWYFENFFGGWAKDNNTEKVLVRTRGKPAELPQNWQFLPQMGGLVVEAAVGAPSVRIPDKADMKNGVVGGIK